MSKRPAFSIGNYAKINILEVDYSYQPSKQRVPMHSIGAADEGNLGN